MQTVATTPCHAAFRQEFSLSQGMANTAPRARRLLDARIPTEVAASSCSVIAIDRTARTQATLALIEVEFATRRDFYGHTLRRAGVAPHELDDALGELFELALRWAGSYDAGKSDISSWLGNQVARTVASSIYGTRRPAWRRQAESESSTDGGGDDSLADTFFAAADDGQPIDECVAAASFLEQLGCDLTETEATVIEICGIDLLHERASEAELAQVRACIGVRSNTTVRRIINDIGNKARALAVEHFDAKALGSRSGYEKLAA